MPDISSASYAAIVHVVSFPDPQECWPTAKSVGLQPRVLAFRTVCHGFESHSRQRSLFAGMPLKVEWNHGTKPVCLAVTEAAGHHKRIHQLLCFSAPVFQQLRCQQLCLLHFMLKASVLKHIWTVAVIHYAGNLCYTSQLEWLYSHC